MELIKIKTKEGQLFINPADVTRVYDNGVGGVVVKTADNYFVSTEAIEDIVSRLDLKVK